MIYSVDLNLDLIQIYSELDLSKSQLRRRVIPNIFQTFYLKIRKILFNNLWVFD
jgi:hypothetical protein